MELMLRRRCKLAPSLANNWALVGVLGGLWGLAAGGRWQVAGGETPGQMSWSCLLLHLLLLLFLPQDDASFWAFNLKRIYYSA